MRTMRRCAFVLTVAAVLSPLSAVAETVTVEVTNNQPMGGFTFSPPWVAFHDGTFDAFDAGAMASPGIETVAEVANPATLAAEFAASGASGVDGVVMSPDAPPPFIPGESGSLMIDIGDASVNRFFSFASMLVPSNDFLLGNDDPTAYEVFDAAGNFNGPLTIQIYSDDAWDAGTEVNDIANGAAFIVGQDATLGATEGGVVTPLFDVAGVDGYLASIVWQNTPIGELTDGLVPGELVATFSIVPEPSALALTTVGAALLALRRR